MLGRELYGGGGGACGCDAGAAALAACEDDAIPGTEGVPRHWATLTIIFGKYSWMKDSLFFPRGNGQ